ncbi:TetR/AcrR family transcriptional regulator [Corynebacterium ammoniagenes]|uniref:Transcriptional regulator n=2 Tax=Corynebacterium ammoniagenes TaxID=1697 RepID=A0AAV5G5V7_CORAM|nr:TetR/AcrR family transcriptional regulator [Corynebacterium ammoniagenes]APT83084.1 transcriptional regulator [Corynebacterium ammoniagenes DSM 20306]AQS74115.1 TetR family transcriptional regulator [Corynebacterium ammoniagenes]EFG82026.1 transcriptional regulator, TetR family [Corynebacterium ammoniagenes DSM 20306]NMF31281.1 TetR/AcrR family transcriptional regulator [Corynebacterium ammoniagenes]GJN42641.1 transcriptional regulator [Corynebacterium ammoniagenes]
MASLRELKKLATRRAISEAAARILLREGLEGLTISLVAEESEVSVRTFHNYFPSIDEALFHFCLDTIEEFLPVVAAYPAGMTMTEVFEDIAVKGLTDEDSEFGSIATLFQIQEHMSARSRFIPHHEEIHAVLHKFLGAFIQLYPELKEAEIALYLQVGAATIVWTADELNRLKVDSPQQVARREDKEAFIRRAFTTLRAIK